MHKIKIFLALSILMLASLACNALSPASEPTPIIILEPTSSLQQSGLPATEADVPRITVEEALVAYSAGAAVFLDVRGPDSFAAGHVPGALNIPVNNIELNPTIPGIDRDEWIITYCT